MRLNLLNFEWIYYFCKGTFYKNKKNSQDWQLIDKGLAARTRLDSQIRVNHVYSPSRYRSMHISSSGKLVTIYGPMPGSAFIFGPKLKHITGSHMSLPCFRNMVAHLTWHSRWDFLAVTYTRTHTMCAIDSAHQQLSLY